MENPNKKTSALNLGLKEILSTEFPKKCSGCQRIYMSADDYITNTTPDLTHDPRTEYYFGANRICKCGSHLSAYSCRRDVSPAGKRRRALFGRLMVELTKLGLAEEVARTELLKVLNRGSSPILEGLGYDPNLLFPTGESKDDFEKEASRGNQAFGLT